MRGINFQNFPLEVVEMEGMMSKFETSYEYAPVGTMKQYTKAKEELTLLRHVLDEAERVAYSNDEQFPGLVRAIYAYDIWKEKDTYAASSE
jgi:hypothetical protein